MRLLSPDGPLVVVARIVAMGVTAGIGVCCMIVAVFNPAVSPSWLIFILGALFLIAALGQLWQWGPLAINARREALSARPIVWGLVRMGYVVEDELVALFLRPGWIFVWPDRVEVFDVSYAMNPKSPSRRVLLLEAPLIRDVSISRRTRLTYDHIFIGLRDGRTAEVEITPKDGWSVRGASGSELEALAGAIEAVGGAS